MRNAITSALVLLALAAHPDAGSSATNPIVLVNDTFTDGDRTTQALPESISLLKAQSSTTVAVSPGAASFTWTTTSADMLYGYFTPAGAPVTLGVGDTLTVRLTFSFSGLNPAAISAPSPGVRFGVLDSQASREVVDGAGTNRTAFVGDTGYALFMPLSTVPPTASAFDLRRRTTFTAGNLFSAGADFTTLATGGVAQAITDADDYTLVYSIHRASATETVLRAQVLGGSLGDSYGLEATETSLVPNTSFDYFAWRVSSSAFAAAMTFKAVAVELTLVPPTITTQPTSQSVAAGAAVTLSAAAAGSAPLAFQWEKDGSPISGAVGSDLTLLNVQPTDSGEYRCSVSNSVGSATSDAAVLTVSGAAGSGPVITFPPRSQTVFAGAPASFTVVATGTGTLSYQWLRAGVPLPAATADTLSFAAAQISDAGVYTVAVTDATGTTYAGPAALNVTSTGPLGVVDDSFADGDRTAFAPPASVAWYKAQGSTAVSVVPGGASFTWATTSADMLFAYFTPSGTPLTLGVGDKLTVRLTFAFTGLNPTAATTTPNGQLRFGILDSKGTRVTADGAGTSNAAYVGDTGYALFTPFSTSASSTTAFDLRRRTTTTTSNVFNSSGDFTTIGSGGGAALAFSDGTDYTLSYTIERLSPTQTRIGGAVTGGTLGDAYTFSTIETSPSPEINFDYLGWRVGSSNFAAAITYRRLTVSVDLTAPRFTTQPVGESTVEEEDVVLSAVAAGSAPLRYQWSKDGSPISGATNPTLTLHEMRMSDSGAYTLTLSNTVGTVTSDVAAVVVGPRPPSVVEPPVSQTILVGDSFSVTVVVRGSEPLAYQWLKDDVPIPGATGWSFVIPAVQLTDSGDYAALVSNAAGSVLSLAATLAVTTSPVPPSITQQPVSLSVIAGLPASFRARAFGTTPLAYQWSHGGSPIPGAIASTLTIPAATPADAGPYTLSVTNSVGGATSDPAFLTVIVPVTVAVQPTNLTVNAGEAASFTVEPAGTPPFSYQWRKNGLNLPGATSQTLTIAPTRAADAGTYSVVLANAGGTATSASATLIMTDPQLVVTNLFPANDQAEVCVDTPLRLGFAVTPTLGTSGVIRIFDASANAVVDTIDLAAASQTRTIGGAAYNYLPVIVNGSAVLITPHAQLAYGKTYFVTMTPGVVKTSNGVFAGWSGDSVLRFATKASAPPAATATLAVAADGTGDFCTVQGAVDFIPTNNALRRLVEIQSGVYQELVHIANKPLITLRGEDRTQTAIVYANNATFNPSWRGVVATDSNDTTLENLTVRNLTPKGGSQAEALRMNGLRTIIRDCDLTSYQDTVWLNRSAFVENTTIAGDVDFLWGSAAAYFSNTELRALSAGYLVQARNPVDQNGFVFVGCRLSGATGITGYWLARVDPNVYPNSQATYINCSMGPHVNPIGWLLNNAATSDTVKFWEYRSVDFNGDPVDVSQRHVSSRQLTDAEAAQWSDPAFVLSGWAPETLPMIYAQPASQVASIGQAVAFGVGAAGRPLPTYQWWKDGAAIPGATESTLTLPAVQASDAGSYSVVVTNTAGSVTSRAATLAIATDSGAPVILTPPMSQTVAVAESATFSVVAEGSSPLAYQWLRNGVAIPNATGASLTIPSVTLADGGFYAVTVTNAVGSVTSLPAALAVHARPIDAPPVILTQPADQTAIVGDTVTFSVQGRAVPSPSYQWVKDGVPIPGATGASLTLENVQVSAAGVYTVVLTNPLDAVTSNPARLTVLRRGRLGGVTVRGVAGWPDELMSVDFTMEGSVAKDVLVRAAGPALRSQHVHDYLRDPRLSVLQGSAVVAANDNWGTASGDIAGVSAAVGAIPFAPGSRDAALLANLAPGAYSADVDGGRGTTQVDVYEVPGSSDESRIVATKTVGLVEGHDDDDLSASFTVGGDTPMLVLIRALGPSLSRVRRHRHLPDPELVLLWGSNVVARNKDWDDGGDGLSSVFARVGADPLPAGSHDAALALTLSPGRYRALVRARHPGHDGFIKLEIYSVEGLTLAEQPQGQTANVGTTVTFGVTAIGAEPLRYQWRRNGRDIPDATSSTLTLTDVQPDDAGFYSVVVGNATDEVTSASALLTLTSPTTQLPPPATFNLEGFASLGDGTTGGGLVDPTDTAHYKVIDSATPDPAATLRGYLESDGPLVVELRTDVDLGSLRNQGRQAIINPELIASGVGVIRVHSDKTLFSTSGATLRHGGLNLDSVSNIILRNLRFRGLWEWDDATQGAYDLQGWDFVALTNSHNVWVDHCDFGKSYDGLVDIVRASDLVTVSWTRLGGDTEDEVTRQIDYLEGLYQANPADPRIAYYAALRQGQSEAEIIRHEVPQDKGDLVGNSDDLGAIDGGRLNVTFHHDAYTLVRQRTPRMRFGNAHVYNVFVDDLISAPFPGTQTAVNSTMNAAVLVENSDFLEVRTPFAFSGGGRVSDRGSVWQLAGALTPIDPTRLNPANPDELLWNPPSAFVWTDLTRLPYAYTLDPADYTRAHMASVGTLNPVDPVDQALLRSYLLMTVH